MNTEELDPNNVTHDETESKYVDFLSKHKTKLFLNFRRSVNN